VLSENLSIIISDVSKKYSKNAGIKAINTKFESGKLNIIIGDNGSGKSTLIKCIMGLVNYSGKITKRKLRIGYAPEEYVMPMHMSVLDFLKSIGRIKSAERDELDRNLIDYLDFFDLSRYKHKPISSLSNGMRQKINLMQAFIHNPKIIILDEPLASLDKESIPKVISLIKDKAKTHLVVLTTHNHQFFKTSKKKLYRFTNGMLVDD